MTRAHAFTLCALFALAILSAFATGELLDALRSDSPLHHHLGIAAGAFATCAFARQFALLNEGTTL